MKKLFLIIVIAFLFSGCRNDGNSTEPDSAKTRVESNLNHGSVVEDETLWFVYTKPINGYNISVKARLSSNYKCFITVYLKQGNWHYSVELRGAYDLFHQDTVAGDTIYFDPPTNRPDSVCLDYRTTVSFADVNFDGEDELIICGFPRADREIGYPLDCEDFHIFKIAKDTLVQLHNVIFDELSQGECRTEFIFNKQNKTITRIGYQCAGITSTCVYWFRNGEPYKKDFIYEVDGERTLYHFMLPKDIEKMKHIEDSVMWN